MRYRLINFDHRTRETRVLFQTDSRVELDERINYFQWRTSGLFVDFLMPNDRYARGTVWSKDPE